MVINKTSLDALFKAFNMAFQSGLGMAESHYDKVSMTIPSATAANTYPWLGKLPSMREWLGDRVIENLALHDYTIKNKAFEQTVGVRGSDIEDDQYGVYQPLFQDLGNQAAIHPNQLVFTALAGGHENPCFDKKPFFAKDHPVGETTASNLLAPSSNPKTPWYLLCTRRPIRPLIFQRRKPYNLRRLDRPEDENVFMRDEYLYGVDARVNVGYGLWQTAVRCTKDLDAASYAEARALMSSYRNEAGTPLGLVPNLLVVPPTLESAARKVVVAATAANGATNEWAGSAELLVSPWLA